MFEIHGDMGSQDVEFEASLARSVDIITQNFKYVRERNRAHKLDPSMIPKIKKLHEELSCVLIEHASAKIIESDNESSSDKEENTRSSVASSAFKTRVNCQLCLAPQNNLTQLYEHLKAQCSVLINKVYREDKPMLSCIWLVLNNCLKCVPCEKFFNNLDNLQTHCQSEEHIATKNKKAAYQTEFIFCTLCKINIPDNELQFEMHLKEDIHVRRNQPQLIPNTTLINDGIHFTYAGDKKAFKCLICKTSFSLKTVNQVQSHKSTSEHLEKIADLKIETGGAIKCLTCDVTAEGIINFQFHLQSDGHNKKTEEMKNEQAPVKARSCIFCSETGKNFEWLVKHQSNECQRLVELGKKAAKESEKPAPKSRTGWCCLLCRVFTSENSSWKKHKVELNHTLLVGSLHNMNISTVEKCCPVCGSTFFATEPRYAEHLESHEKPPQQPPPVGPSVQPNSPEPPMKPVVTKAKKAKTKQKQDVNGKPDNAVYVNGCPPDANMVTVKEQLEIFGGIDQFNVAPDGVLTVCYKTQDAVKNILRTNFLRINGQTVTVTQKLVEDSPGKQKTKEEKAPAELKAEIISLFDPLRISDPEAENKTLKNDRPPSDNSNRFSSTDYNSDEFCILSDNYNREYTKYEKAAKLCGEVLKGKTAHIIGSRKYNLAWKDSGVDVFVDTSMASNEDYFSMIFQMFVSKMKDSPKFEDVEEVSNRDHFPTIKCRMSNCDLNIFITFGSHHALEKTELINSYVKSDSRVRSLLLRIKGWALDKDLIGQDKFTGFSLFMMAIFFMQNINVLAKGKGHQSTALEILEPRITDFYTKGINSTAKPHEMNKSLTVTELFDRFFTFYKRFDRKNQIVCLPLCCPIPKYFLKHDVEKQFVGDLAICIMDPFEHHVNLTKSLSQITLTKFLDFP